MSKRVLVVGGSGLVGEPIVRRLVETGAEVGVATRGNAPIAPDLADEVNAAIVDRTAAGALEDAVGKGVDALVDVIPYRATDARQPLRLKGKVGTVVAISSAAVYAGSDGHGLLDADDSDRPVSIAQIGQSVAALMDHQWKEVLFAGPPTPDGVGDSPWTTLKPSVLDMSAAREELGYRDVIRYEEALRRTCGMARANRPQPKVARRLPRAAEYYGGLFDYEEEDELAVRIKRSQSGSRRQP